MAQHARWGVERADYEQTQSGGVGTAVGLVLSLYTSKGHLMNAGPIEDIPLSVTFRKPVASRT